MMFQKKVSIIFFGFVAVLAIFFYLNNGKTVTLKETTSPVNFIDQIFENSDQEKITAADALNDLSLVVEEFDALRVPGESFENEYSNIKQIFASGDYSKTIAESRAIEKIIRTSIEEENQKPKISITFDAGAGLGATQKLIDYLADSRLKITFFSTGKWTEQNTELFKKILVPKEGLINELGNHTYSHPHLVSGGLTDEQIKEEITKTENIFNSLGYPAKPLRQAQGKLLFRYPYGERNAHTDALLKDLGYVSVYWTVDSLGWQNKQTSEQIAERIISKIGPKGITLMHVGSNEDVASVPSVVERLKSQYRFVFVSEL
ncbi:MAG: Polysaccharide deacetylase [Parcubacteria group bacterium GW2011_GWA2_40_8]|nr:MAG: Polysaccharide deacetylase [Parcubacteria group bacterium GW2011_GWA2_40_8]